MEIYAGMVANLDYHVGRLIQHLQDIGEYDKTFILFHSDNGAEGWPISPGDPKATDEGNAAAGVYETLGGDNGQQNAKSIHYGLRWAEVSATPFAQVKGQLGEGGVSTAAVAHLPGQVGQAPDIDWFSHVTDDTATFLAIAGVTPPSVAAPPNIDPSTGGSTATPARSCTRAATSIPSPANRSWARSISSILRPFTASRSATRRTGARTCSAPTVFGRRVGPNRRSVPRTGTGSCSTW